MKGENLNNGTNILRVPNEEFFANIRPFLAQGKQVKIMVLGNSMKPFINNGEQIILNPIKEGDIKIGFIVLAATKQGYILHRIIKVRGEGLLLAGDGNLLQIEHVSKSEIIAYVFGVIRGGKIINPHTNQKLLAAKMWFFARPFRIVYHKLKQLIKR